MFRHEGRLPGKAYEYDPVGRHEDKEPREIETEKVEFVLSPTASLIANINERGELELYASVTGFANQIVVRSGVSNALTLALADSQRPVQEEG